jgi:hypothetical protein
MRLQHTCGRERENMKEKNPGEKREVKGLGD